MALQEFGQARKAATQAVGLTGKLFDDFPRTAVRDMVRAGIPERVAQQISGHKTGSAFGRCLHERGWVWKRAKLVANDDDPPRVNRLARIRYVFEPLRVCEALGFAAERDSHLLPTMGCAWMPKGTELEVMTPGQNQKHYLAGAVEPSTGTRRHCLGPRNTNALSHEQLTRLDERSPADR